MSQHIFETLLKSGRLQISQLARKSRLALRNVKAGLCVLIQAHLLYHFTTSEGQTFYQANWRAAYNLIRTGKILHSLEQKYGRKSAQIIEQLLVNGHLQISVLKSLLEYNSSTQQNTALAQLFCALDFLAEKALIRQVRSAHFESEYDSRLLAESRVLNNGQQWDLKGSKKKEDFQRAVERLISERADGRICMGAKTTGEQNGVKRPREDSIGGPDAKRRRLHTDTRATGNARTLQTDSLSASEPSLAPFNEETVVRADAENFTRLLHSQTLAHAAQESLGKQASETYQYLLDQLEIGLQTGQVIEDHDPFDTMRSEKLSSPGIAVTHLCQQIRSKIKHQRDNNTRRVRLGQEMNGIHKPPTSHVRSQHTHVNGFETEAAVVSGNALSERANPVYGDDKPGPDSEGSGEHSQVSEEDIERQLEILSEAPYRFTIAQQNAEQSMWKVPLTSLTGKLQEREIFRLIKARYGEVAVRLVRILMAKGKTDERILQELALLTPKDARKVLAQLQKAGFIDVQEVPRENQRLPNRTYYFWFFDKERCHKLILERVYKSMVRCLRRLERESDKERALLAKAARTNVQGREDEALSKREYQRWNGWRRKKELLLGELSRLDHIVAILRDF
ncbi:MAG: hypothetical protein Q9227_008102 [Pyrenula ochraceoflavens]